MLPFKNGAYILNSSNIYTSVQKHYQSEVCVISWIHEEVDYNVQALVLVEPKDHLKGLHLKGKV